MSAHPVCLHAISTAVPSRVVTQEEALLHALASQPDVEPRRIRALYRRSGVRTRSIAVPDSEQAMTRGILAPREHAASTGERMAVYEREIVPLAEQAARGALLASGTDAKSITHVIAVSCTGFMAPGLDSALVRTLGLPHTVARLIVGFMGCHGALNGLRTAHAFVAADPSAHVLLVCAELCSLHFSAEATPGGQVANALFADGAAATVLSAQPARAPGKGWQLVDSISAILAETADQMGWRIGDRGFEMVLSTAVPDHFAGVLPGTITPWLARHELSPRDVAWAVHPGGPRIVDVVESELGLDPVQMEPSRSVLADQGNMSSPTVLFILSRVPEDARHAVMIAFGPGLAMEAALLRRC